MADPITVYKVVRAEVGGVLRSCVLHGTAAQFYRDRKDRLRTVKKAFAFATQQSAEAFRRGEMCSDWQVWSAVTETKQRRTLIYLPPIGTIIGGRPRDRRDLEVCAAREDLMRYPAPGGTVDCTNLRLVERVA